LLNIYKNIEISIYLEERDLFAMFKDFLKKL